MIAILVSQGMGIGYLPDYFVNARPSIVLQEY